MRPVLLDTNAYVAFKRGDRHIAELLQLASSIAITPIVLGELQAGFNSGSRIQQNKADLKSFLSSPRVHIYTISSDSAHFFGQIHSQLKQKGQPIPTNDMWIGAQALEYGCLVYTDSSSILEFRPA